MQCTRRPDLTPHTRVAIVGLAGLYQGVYRNMTPIARGYQISRALLFPLLLAANLQLEGLWSDAKLLPQKDHQQVEPLILLLRLAGPGSLRSISSILKALDYPPHAVGARSQFFPSAGQTLPSTVSMPSKTWVFDLSEAICALHAPLLVTIDVRSTTPLNIDLASERSAETWQAHFEALEQHQFVSLGMVSDRGLGLVAGYQAACTMAWWVADSFHEFRDRFDDSTGDGSRPSGRRVSRCCRERLPTKGLGSSPIFLSVKRLNLIRVRGSSAQVVPASSHTRGVTG